MPSGNRPLSEAMLTKICDTTGPHWVNTLRPRQNGRHCPDDRFKWILMHKDVCISIKMSLKFVRGVQLTIFQHWRRPMAWRQPGNQDLKSGTHYTYQLVFPKLWLCPANHSPGYCSNLPCDWPSTAWARDRKRARGQWSQLKLSR